MSDHQTEAGTSKPNVETITQIDLNAGYRIHDIKLASEIDRFILLFIINTRYLILDSCYKLFNVNGLREVNTMCVTTRILVANDAIIITVSRVRRRYSNNTGCIRNHVTIS